MWCFVDCDGVFGFVVLFDYDFVGVCDYDVYFGGVIVEFDLFVVVFGGCELCFDLLVFV